MNVDTIICGDSAEVLATFPDGCIQMCVSSPPYYGLRDYGTAKWKGGDPICDHKAAKEKSRYDYAEIAMTTKGTDGAKWKNICPTCGAVKMDSQIGLEETPEAYVSKLVAVFHEVKRALKDDGTLWLNLGDSYAGSGGAGGDYNPGGLREGQPRFKSTYQPRSARQVPDGKNPNAGVPEFGPNRQPIAGCKPKDLIGIPWIVAFALRADGWWLRQEIIWNKPNPMPESVTDRCTKSHEQIFLLAKSARYYCDMEAIKEPAVNGDSTSPRGSKANERPNSGTRKEFEDYQGGDGNGFKGHSGNKLADGTLLTTRNKRSVWTVTTKPYSGAHFATFPPDLIEPCILAGSRPGDVVLDPFFGSGTTGQVAQENGRHWIGIDLSPEYCKLAQKRVDAARVPLFVEGTKL